MCFYFVFTVFSTVGFGDIFAVNTTERVILTTFDKGGGGDFKKNCFPLPIIRNGLCACFAGILHISVSCWI